MKLAHLKVENFRSLKDVEVPLQSFVCAVGENNSGKSSLLVALSLFLSGSKLRHSDYYDPSKDVVITATITGLTNSAIESLGATHAERIGPIVRQERLTLVRRYNTDGGSTLRCIRPVPADSRFADEDLTALMRGKRGPELRTAVHDAFPELANQDASTQQGWRDLVNELIQSLPPQSLVERETPLPTGIDNSVAALLPEPIYIPAVKDIADDLKTKEAATFGRIVKFLLEVIGQAEELGDVTASFDQLRTMLNVEISGKGDRVDNRLEQIRNIEKVVGDFVREQFRAVEVEFEIPPPDLKTVFTGAKIYVDDGIRDLVDTKGDGLKRAVTFALIRAHVSLRNAAAMAASDAADAATTGHYLFLFEEPELYLHPGAQRILYDALHQIAENQQVCVSTHSPYFFSPRARGTFLRLRKVAAPQPVCAPLTQVLPIDLLADIPKRDAFQIICYENNSAAFFCNRVVLVEGDCDLIFLKHVSRLFRRDWDFDARNIPVVRVGGKGNFQRYRAFFEAFDAEVHLIGDLDCVVDQFEKLGADSSCAGIQASLLQKIDGLLENGDTSSALKGEQAKAIASRRTFLDRYERVKETVKSVASGGTPTPQQIAEMEELFSEERIHRRRSVLRTAAELLDEKEKLLNALRGCGINVLSRGSIEDYYPPGATGADKPSRALDACARVRTPQDANANCPSMNDGNGTSRSEFELIFANIFGD